MLGKSKKAQEEYWTSRAEKLILAAEKTQEEMSSDLAKVYADAQKAIQKELDAFYGKFARDVGVTLEEARKALSKSELKSYYEQTKEYYAAIEATGYAFDPAYRQKLHRQLSRKSAVSRLEALQADVQWQVEKLYAQEQGVFRDALGSIYEDAYMRVAFGIQSGTGIGGSFSALNTKLIEKAVSKKWLGENYSTRIWTDKDRLTLNLEQIIPQGISLGRNPRLIGKDIADQLDVRRSYGERLARTETNFIANAATYDGYKEAGVEQFQFLATLDNRTSEICGETDNKIFNLSDKMVGVNWPPLHPNCRSTTVPFWEPDEIDKMFEEATRIARDPTTGKNVYVPASLSYSDWKKGLVEKDGKLQYDPERR